VYYQVSRLWQETGNHGEQKERTLKSEDSSILQSRSPFHSFKKEKGFSFSFFFYFLLFIKRWFPWNSNFVSVDQGEKKKKKKNGDLRNFKRKKEKREKKIVKSKKKSTSRSSKDYKSIRRRYPPLPLLQVVKRERER